jgi:predicted transglutaminase-like cysteine proteinase
MTSRCAIFIPGKKGSFEETSNDKNKSVWKSVDDNLTKATELIKKEIERRGIVITAEDIEKAAKEQEKKTTFIDNHELNHLSTKYWKTARPVLQSIDMADFASRSIQEVELGIKSTEEQQKQLNKIERNLEVLHFYLFFINVKCNRAISGLLDEDEWEEDEDTHIPNDTLGSAKIALLTTRSSIAAWVLVMEHNIFTQDEILPVLAILQKIETLIINYFPKVEVYKRPGFDD